MKPVVRNITIHLGSDFELWLTFRDADGTPKDLTENWVVKMQVRLDYESDDVQVEASSEDGTIVLGDAENNIKIRVPAADLDDLPRDKSGVVPAYYDVLAINTVGEELVATRRLVMGRSDLSSEVTRTAVP